MLNMNGVKKNTIIFMIILLSVLSSINIYAQDNNNYYPAQILEVKKENIKKRFFIRPISGDITVRWRLSGYDNQSGFDHYRIYCENATVSDLIDSSDVLNANDPYTFQNKQAGIRWNLYIKGFKGSSYHVISDTSYTIIGKTRNYVKIPNVIKLIFLGKLPLSLLGKGEKYENASVTGKGAFFVLWIFMLALIPFIFLFLPRLNYNRVFPVEERKYIKKTKLFNKDIDRVLSDEFSYILEYWNRIITHSKEQINSEINKRLKKNEEISISEVEGANVKHWADEGMKGIQTLIKEINDKEKWKHIPTVNIFKVGLESHEINGYHWIEVSKEVDRAIENRAASEIEILRRKSHVDWLWNIGTLAPIVGLFGTATGISKVFDDIQPSISQGQQMITELSGGINEALWTTIEGLAISFIFLMVYYYFNNKLKRIYMKWEKLYVRLSEKIHDKRDD
ncbi:MAG: MotA/TolQ/ExbB proton channel family protein [bacterium]